MHIPLLGPVVDRFTGALLRRSEVTVGTAGLRFICRGDAGGVAINLLRHGVYEKALVDFLTRNLRPGGRFLDVGANIGYFTLIAGAIAGPGGRVCALEPDSMNFRFLTENVRRAGLRNVTALPFAAAGRPGWKSLFISSENPGDHRLALMPGERRRRVTVRVVRVDDILPEKSLDFAKVDVQGAEPLVLEGMRETIENSPDIVIAVEWSRPHYEAFGWSPGSFLQLLELLSLRPAVLERDGTERDLPGSRELESDAIVTLLLRRA